MAPGAWAVLPGTGPMPGGGACRVRGPASSGAVSPSGALITLPRADRQSSDVRRHSAYQPRLQATSKARQIGTALRGQAVIQFALQLRWRDLEATAEQLAQVARACEAAAHREIGNWLAGGQPGQNGPEP
jgi:hypothetical protein